MKVAMGIAMIVAGLALGLYLGLWVCFIGGIVQIIDQIKSPGEVQGLQIAYGSAKIVCAGAVGSIAAMFGIVPGIAALGSD